MNKIYVIGIGYKPLNKRAREIIHNSEIILASDRLSGVFKGYEEFEKVKNKVKVINNVDETFDFIKSHIEDTPPYPPFDKGGYGGVVLLASGDPMFFGIGRRAVKEFGKDMVEIIPDLSSIQIAFSRIKEPWDDAFLISLHGGPDPEKRRRLEYEIKDIPCLLEKHDKICILTDKENNPSLIAKQLLLTSHFPLPALKMYVCERLGYSDEKIIEGTLEEIVVMSFSEPNVVIIQSTEHRTQSTESQIPNLKSQISNFGLTEDEIQHSRGLITKDEVRAVTIHKLRLPQRGVFWDIGAGSGAVSTEGARLCPELKVFAIEKDEEQINHIHENMIKFSIENIEIIKGEAPDVLINLLPPDRVFIGGAGGRLKEIIDFIAKMPAKIIVVINAATIETLNTAIQNLENNGLEVEVSEVSISRSKIISGKKHMNALNPVYTIIGEKK